MDVGLVCDACSALTPIGVPQCKRCGAAVAVDPRAKSGSRPPPTVQPEGSPCAKCNTFVSKGTRFCPNCGARVVEKTPFDDETRVGPRAGGTAPQPAKGNRSTLFMGGALQSARAKLTLIRDDGEGGVSFTLAGTGHPARRGETPARSHKQTRPRRG